MIFETPVRTAEWLIAEAKQIAAVLRNEQDESDARGFYSDAIHQRLLDGGFYRIIQPKTFGGLGTDAETYIRVIMALSQGHPASGWCYTLASSHALVLGSVFSEETQRELFGTNGDFRACYAASPAGCRNSSARTAGTSLPGCGRSPREFPCAIISWAALCFRMSPVCSVRLSWLWPRTKSPY